jgi:hypothetical protein
MEGEPFRLVDFPGEYPQQDVFEHHVLMAFSRDKDALLFHEWWRSQGAIAFNRWMQTRKET